MMIMEEAINLRVGEGSWKGLEGGNFGGTGWRKGDRKVI